MTYLICDIDGVLWTRNSVLPKVKDGLEIFRQNNVNIYFVTNNSFIPVKELETRITNLGFDATGRVITSPMVVAALLPKGSKIFAMAGEGTLQALIDKGHQLCAVDENPTYVVVGLRTDFDYAMLTKVCRAVRAGAQLIGTNDDPAFPTEDGLLPGGGALLSAIETGSESTAKVYGKPHSPMVSHIMQLVNGRPIDYVIGDRTDHDGQFAAKLGSRFINIVSDATKSTDDQITRFDNLFDAANYVINHSNSSEI